MRENEKLVTLEQFETRFEAEQAKQLLDDAGISCVMAGIDNMPYPTVITIDLQVFERDVERAKEVLEQEQTGDDMQDPEDAE